MTPSSSSMQVWRVAACQLVSGRFARFNRGLKERRMKLDECRGLPSVLTNTSLSPLTSWPLSLILSRWRMSASVALTVSPTLLRLPFVLGVSKVWPPSPFTSARCMCMTLLLRSRFFQYSTANSPQRAPEVKPNTKRASYLSLSAAALKRLASSLLNGLISGAGIFGLLTASHWFLEMYPQLTATFKDAARTSCIRLTLAADKPLSRLRVYMDWMLLRSKSVRYMPPNSGFRCSRIMSLLVS